jgi:hypothetical protein
MGEMGWVTFVGCALWLGCVMLSGELVACLTKGGVYACRAPSSFGVGGVTGGCFHR